MPEELITQTVYYSTGLAVNLLHRDALTYVRYISIVMFFNLIPNKRLIVFVFFRLSNEQLLSNNSIH